MSTKRIEYKGALIAIIIRNDFSKNGIEFFTPNDFSQQLAYMKRPKGYLIEPHLHNKVKRSVLLTQEVLFLKNGKVKVSFFNDNKIYICSEILYAGDIILLASGGHGLEILEESEIIEVKQGPYSGDKYKTRFKYSDKDINDISK